MVGPNWYVSIALCVAALCCIECNECIKVYCTCTVLRCGWLCCWYRNGSTIALFILSCMKATGDIDDMTLQSAVSASLNRSVVNEDFDSVLNASVTLISVEIDPTTSFQPSTDVTSTTTSATSNYTPSTAVTVSGNNTASTPRSQLEANSTTLSNSSTPTTTSVSASWTSGNKSTTEDTASLMSTTTTTEYRTSVAAATSPLVRHSNETSTDHYKRNVTNTATQDTTAAEELGSTSTSLAH